MMMAFLYSEDKSVVPFTTKSYFIVLYFIIAIFVWIGAIP